MRNAHVIDTVSYTVHSFLLTRRSEQEYSLPLAALPLCRVITTCCFMVYSSQGPRCFGFTERHRSRVELKSTVCDLPRWAKRQGPKPMGYRFIGKTLLAALSSPCGKWRLRSCTNIIIKAASGNLV